MLLQLLTFGLDNRIFDQRLLCFLILLIVRFKRPEQLRIIEDQCR
ncbi:MAG: hypothetical protein OIN88_00635 [Candidatus Methanoperedens sp.]|nr:hypothetical protein [Candidatus Methanoperedens sp.]